MSDLEQPEVPEQHRLVGEDTPTWLTIGFSLIGTLLAAAAVWLWMTEQTPVLRTTTPQAQDSATVSTAQPAIDLSTKPVSEPAETPKIVAEVEKDQLVQSESISPPSDPNKELISSSPPGNLDNQLISPPSVSADTLAEPSDVQDSADNAADDTDNATTEDQTTPPASAQLPIKPQDCPPIIMIPFKHNNAQPEITADIQSHLEQLREWLNDRPQEKLSVEGHADSKGSERGNLLISYKRAKEAAALLNKAGIPEAQMIIVAFGEHSPIEGMSADAKDNRRVLLQVKGMENCQKASTDREKK